MSLDKRLTEETQDKYDALEKTLAELRSYYESIQQQNQDVLNMLASVRLQLRIHSRVMREKE